VAESAAIAAPIPKAAPIKTATFLSRSQRREVLSDKVKQLAPSE
jgi:hypothetical protein